jgi:hypothetical protein
MSKQEWESLCDGCGMCCVNKLEYEGTGELAQTDTCCKLLDPKTARCKDYKNRKKIVPDCIQLTPKVVAKDGLAAQDLWLTGWSISSRTSTGGTPCSRATRKRCIRPESRPAGG